MKNFLLVCLAIAVMVLGFLVYEYGRVQVNREFPVVPHKAGGSQHPLKLYLHIFFSAEAPSSHLGVIKVLNRLPAHFQVIGVVSGFKQENEVRMRRKTGAEFPLKEIGHYLSYQTFFSPTIVCCTEKGRILFQFPVVPGEEEVFKHFLFMFYQTVYPSLLKDKDSPLLAPPLT